MGTPRTGQAKPRLSPNSRLRPAGSPAGTPRSALRDKAATASPRAGHVLARSLRAPRPRHGRDSVPKGLGPPWGRGDPGARARSPRPASRRRSPVQHFADPLAHASPGGGGQAAAAAAALGRQILDGGHHMVLWGRRRRLQLLLRRLGGKHRGGGGGAARIRTQPGASCAGSGPGTRRGPGGPPRPGGGAACEAARRGGTRAYGRLRPARHSLLSGPGVRTLAPPPPASCPGSSRDASPSPGKPRKVTVKARAGMGAARGLGRLPRREEMRLRALPSLLVLRSSPGERRPSPSPACWESCRLSVSRQVRDRVNPRAGRGYHGGSSSKGGQGGGHEHSVLARGRYRGAS